MSELDGVPCIFYWRLLALCNLLPTLSMGCHWVLQHPSCSGSPRYGHIITAAAILQLDRVTQTLDPALSGGGAWMIQCASFQPSTIPNVEFDWKLEYSFLLLVGFGFGWFLPLPPLFQIWNKRGVFLVEAKSRFPVLCCTGWVLALQCVPALSCLLPLLCWGAGAGDSCSERYLRGCFLQKTFSQFWGQLCYLFA